MRAYSVDFRERVLADFDGGMGNEAVARKYRVSSRWVYKLRMQRAETGDIAPRRGKTGPKRKLAEHSERLLQLVEEQPDATLEELRDRLGVQVCVATIYNTLKTLGVTLKKGRACGGTRPTGWPSDEPRGGSGKGPAASIAVEQNPVRFAFLSCGERCRAEEYCTDTKET
jgi:transposase